MPALIGNGRGSTCHCLISANWRNAVWRAFWCKDQTFRGNLQGIEVGAGCGDFAVVP